MENRMTDIVERVKDVLSHDHPGQKIFDKNVAYELGIIPDTLKSKKNRGLVPYDELMMFCIRRRVSPTWLLFGIGPMRMEDAKKSV
jgi:hypothetical protein